MHVATCIRCLVLLTIIFTAAVSANTSQHTQLRIIHTNDIHAHLDEFNNRDGLDCRPDAIDSGLCVGGIARLRTMVDRIRTADKNTLFFDAGDQFQGTLFYTFFKGKKIAEFMNDIKYDLMCIGNHELDDGEYALYDFLRNLTFPIVSSNIDLNTTKYLHKVVQPYTIIEKNGIKIGVVGFITRYAKSTTRGAFDLTFLDPVAPVQRAVDELHQKGIRKIIGVSHNGYEDDQYLAKNTYGVNLIVGGHSHTLLLKNGTREGASGTYPTPVINLANQTTYVVQAHRWGDYLGNVLVKWDCDDQLISVEGDPILLSQEIPKHGPTAEKVAEWRAEFDVFGNEVICEVLGDFDSNCSKFGPCPMGDLISDAMLAAREKTGTQIALINSGTVRAILSPGNATYSDFASVLPFGDVLAESLFSGQQILDMLEAGAAFRNQPARGGEMLHSFPRWAGLKYSMDISAPLFHRISNVAVRNSTTNLYEPLDLNLSYKVVTDSFVLSGGDNIVYPAVLDHAGIADQLDCVIKYAKLHSPVSPVTDDRLIVFNRTSLLVQIM